MALSLLCLDESTLGPFGCRLAGAWMEGTHVDIAHGDGRHDCKGDETRCLCNLRRCLSVKRLGFRGFEIW